MTPLKRSDRRPYDRENPPGSPNSEVYARRRLAAVLLPLMALALVVNAATSTAGSFPRPIDEPRKTASDPPTPPRAKAVPSPRLRRDPRGPLFGVSAGEVHRFAPARPGRKVALIFDDGPGSQTPHVIRELRRGGARATFFLIGEEIAARPSVVGELRAAGMELGNHSWSHGVITARTPQDQRKEVASAQRAIEATGGGRPRLFRPPEIIWNEETAKAASAEQTIGVLHTIETHDYQRPSVEAIIASTLPARGGDIIALHDAGGDRSQTVAAIQPMVRALRERGLEPVTVSELIGYPRPMTLEEARGAQPPEAETAAAQEPTTDRQLTNLRRLRADLTESEMTGSPNGRQSGRAGAGSLGP